MAKKPFHKKKSTIKQIVNKTIEKKIQSFAETKMHLTEIDAEYGYDGAVVQLSAIAQGDTQGNRDGNEIQLKSLVFRTYGVASDAYNVQRIIIFRWKEDSAPVVADILQDVAGAGSQNVISPTSFNQKSRYTILYDTFLTSIGTYVPVSRVISHHLNLKGSKCVYNGANATSYENNQLWVLFISDSDAATHPTFHWYSELTYNDV